MPTADEVLVLLDVDMVDYDRKLAQAEKRFDKTEKTITAGAGRMGKGISAGMALATGAIGGFVGGVVASLPGLMTQLVKTGLDYAGSLQEQAQQAGVSTKALQEYRYAASQTGLKVGEIDRALAQFTKTIGEIGAGTKRPIKALAEIGLSVEQISEISRMTADEALPVLADALQDIEDPAKRARVEMALFGETGQKLDPLLAGGSEAINGLRNAAADLGVVLSEKEIQEADKLADRLDDLKQVLAARIAGVVADNADSILSLADALFQLPAAAAVAIKAWNDFKNALDAQAYNLAANNPFLSAEKRKEGAVRAARARGKISDNGVGWGVGGDTVIIDLAPPKPVKPPRPTRDTSIDPDVAMALAGKTHRARRAQRGGGRDNAAEEAKRKAEEAARNLARYTDDLADAQNDLVQVTARVTGTEEARHEAALADIEARRAATARDIKNNEDYTEAQKTALLALNDQVAAQKVALENAEDQQRRDDEALQTRLDGIRTEEELLQAKIALASTAKERAELETRLLALQIEEEKARQDAIIASRDSSAAEKEAARARLAALPGVQAGQQEQIDRDAEGPGKRALRELNADLSDLSDNFEQLELNAIKGLEDGLVSAAGKALGLKGAMGDIVGELIRMAVQMLVIKPLMEALFGGTGAGGAVAGGSVGSSLVSGGLKLFGSIFGGGMTARASGGSAIAGHIYKVNEESTEAFQPAQSGRIIPLGRMAGGLGGDTIVNQQIVLDARYGITTKELMAHVNQTAATYAANAGQHAIRSVEKRLPARLGEMQRLGQ